MEHGLRQVEVFVKGPGSGREAAIRALQAAGPQRAEHSRRHANPAQRLPRAQAAPRLGEAGQRMARYTGAVCRLCRRYGEKLYLKGDRCFGPSARSTSAGRLRPDGASQRRRKVSDRGLQLREKQRARVFYGLLERQFRGYYDEALRKTGVTGDSLVRIAGVAPGQRRLPAGLRRLAQAGAPAGAPRPHQPERPQDGHPFGAGEGRRRRSASRRAAPRRSTPRSLPGDAEVEAGAVVAVAGHGGDEGPGHRRADAGGGRSASSTPT